MVSRRRMPAARSCCANIWPGSICRGSTCRMPIDTAALTFDSDGAQLFAAALDEHDCRAIEQHLAGCPADIPGVRIGRAPGLADMLAPSGAIGRVAASALGPQAKPVRAVLFDKTAARNWALGWHQDRTIVVAERIYTEGFGPWTVKAGLIQVEPPFSILDRMVTLRVHLDPVDTTNAPLRIVPGSHVLGRLPEGAIDGVVARWGERVCLAGRGDVWLYATPIVHGSRAADPPRRRRVVQIDYSADALPEPLTWRGL